MTTENRCEKVSGKIIHVTRKCRIMVDDDDTQASNGWKQSDHDLPNDIKGSLIHANCTDLNAGCWQIRVQ